MEFVTEDVRLWVRWTAGYDCGLFEVVFALLVGEGGSDSWWLLVAGFTATAHFGVDWHVSNAGSGAGKEQRLMVSFL